MRRTFWTAFAVAGCCLYSGRTIGVGVSNSQRKVSWMLNDRLSWVGSVELIDSISERVYRQNERIVGNAEHLEKMDETFSTTVARKW